MNDSNPSHSQGFTIVVGDRQLELKVVRAEANEPEEKPTSTPVVLCHDYAQSTSSNAEGYRRLAEANFLCLYCDKSFDHSGEVAEHEIECPEAFALDDGEGQSEVPLACECGKIFASLDELGIHQKIHELAGIPVGRTSDSTHRCPQCGQKFSTPLQLAAHEATHTGYRPHQCEACGKVFVRRADLVAHERTHKSTPITGGPVKPFVCRFCDKKFSLKNSLDLHERIHMGEKPFECQICSKVFGRQGNFEIHLKLHASGRRFFCCHCGKWFKAARECDEHQQLCQLVTAGQIADPMRPVRYQCQFCPKKFPYRRDVLIHERRHTGEKPFSCGYCDKRFCQQQSLTIHIRIHTGERPFPCRICEEKFRDSSSLRKHEFTRHPEVFSVGPDSTALLESTTAGFNQTSQSVSDSHISEENFELMAELDAVAFAV